MVTRQGPEVRLEVGGYRTTLVKGETMPDSRAAGPPTRYHAHWPDQYKFTLLRKPVAKDWFDHVIWDLLQ